MSNQLIIGVLLIAAGVLLAVVAYWVISSSGSTKKPESTDEATGGDDADEAVIETGVPDPLTLDHEDISDDLPELPDDAQISTAQDDLEIKNEIALEQPPRADLPIGSDDIPPEMGEVEVDIAGKPDLQPQAGQRISIATLLRDEVTGQLIVKVGDTEYHSSDDLRASNDWIRVEYAVSDLQTWTSQDAPVQPRVELEPETAEPKPTSMIEQIDAILQEKIDSSGRSHLGVRLMESPGGAARVLIGVQSYDLADVPDEEVRQLIQEAVAIWEADQ